MSSGFFDYELEKFSILKNILVILEGKDPDYPLTAVFYSKEERLNYCFVESLWGGFLEPPRPKFFYLIIYKMGSPSYLILDRDYERPEYRVYKLTKNQSNRKKFSYRFWLKYEMLYNNNQKKGIFVMQKR